MKFKLAALFLLITITAMAQEASVTSGKLDHITQFASKYVDSRNVDVWLPDGYSRTNRYAVLYMHDGQMLYDAAITWNKQAWEVDEVAGQLIKEGKTQPFIIVGIWNNSQKRHYEYFPQKPFEQLTKVQQDTVTAQLQKAGRVKGAFQPVSDNYLKFLVKELKPYIDKTYATKADKDHTFIAGSSMGGLISMYAICEYPKVFAGAACMSTHWPGTFIAADNPMPEAFLGYLKKNLPKPTSHKLYFDYGDQTLDAMYPKLQAEVDKVMVTKGYRPSQWLTKFFPGNDHSEKSWHERFHFPLEFLLGIK
jgi:predicted alpha/beta superfamily hydrolase